MNNYKTFWSIIKAIEVRIGLIVNPRDFCVIAFDITSQHQHGTSTLEIILVDNRGPFCPI